MLTTYARVLEQGGAMTIEVCRRKHLVGPRIEHLLRLFRRLLTKRRLLFHRKSAEEPSAAHRGEHGYIGAGLPDGRRQRAFLVVEAHLDHPVIDCFVTLRLTDRLRLHRL